MTAEPIKLPQGIDFFTKTEYNKSSYMRPLSFYRQTADASGERINRISYQTLHGEDVRVPRSDRVSFPIPLFAAGGFCHAFRPLKSKFYRKERITV